MADFGLSDNGLEQMYQEFILEAARNPHGKEKFLNNKDENHSDSLHSSQNENKSGIASHHLQHESCSVAQSHQFNPTCGDEVTVRIELSNAQSKDSEPILQKVSWDGQGCSISQASLSVMTDLITGKTLSEFNKLATAFHTLMNSRGKSLTDASLEDLLGDAMVFEGVSRYPMRIKCALLGWAGAKDSIAQALTSGNNKKQ